MNDAASLEDSNKDNLVSRAVRVWQKAQVVYQNPSWKGHPEATVVAEEIASSHPECEQALASLLHHDSQLVAAYALLTLEMMGSTLLQDLPPDVLERRSNVTLSTGSFKTGMDLGGLARQIQKRARARGGH